MAQSLTVDFGQSLNSLLLNARNPFQYIYQLSNGYGAATSLFSALAGGKSSESITTAEGKKEILTITSTRVQAVVATRTVSGANLILTWVDPTYDYFRLKFVVMDGSSTRRLKGYITAKGAGTITISPVGTAFTAADFAVGSYTSEVWQASANNGSTGVESSYITPGTDYNYASIKRETCFLGRRDFYSSLVDFSQGGKNWAFMQENEMLKRFFRDKENAALFEERGQIMLDGKLVNQNGSLLWAIQNRGGSHIKSPVELTEDEWLDLIDGISKKSGKKGGKLLCIHGTDMLGTLQRFNASYIQTAGINNTFGAEYGINMTRYDYNGVTVNFLYSQLLDDPQFMGGISTINGKQRSSSSFFLIDTEPVDTYGDSNGIASAIIPFHFGDKPLSYHFIPGTIGPDGSSPSNYIRGKYAMTSNSVDGVTTEILCDGGYDIPNASRMLFWELAS